MTTKIATCCYCGTRTTLKLTARDGHELACANCGAPLHEMKALPQETRKKKKKKSKSAYYAESRSPQERRDWSGDERDYGDRRRKKKKRKSGWKRAFEEVFDVVEDIFD